MLVSFYENVYQHLSECFGVHAVVMYSFVKHRLNHRWKIHQTYVLNILCACSIKQYFNHTIRSQGDKVFKSVFIIFFQGDQLKTRVKKICEGFRATLYPCPEAPSDRREMAMGVMTRIEDLNTVLGQTQDHRHRVLVAAAKNLKNWFVKVRKIKAIYHTLNLFNLDVTQKCLIAECWVPVLDIETIQLALRRGTVS